MRTHKQGINTTEDERIRQAAEDLANKLALERQFAIDLRRIFREIALDYRAELGATGRVIQASEFEADMVGILRRHYRRTFRRFSGQLRQQIKTIFGRETKGINEDIQTENRQFIFSETEARAEIIINTTQGQLDKAAVKAREQFVEENPGESITDEAAMVAIAIIASRNFVNLIPFRSDTIAATEVQNAAEEAKLIESTILAASAIVDIPKKQWMALFENTRLSHADADGQVQVLTQPFQVQGQLLRRPGDTSLGATVDNIVHCQCSSVSIILA